LLVISSVAASADRFEIEEPLHAENEEMISDLVKDQELCQMDKSDCETALQKALNRKDQLNWYQEPVGILSIAVVSAIIGGISYALVGGK
jgi:hypothetical protein